LEVGGKDLEGKAALAKELEAKLAAENRSGKNVREELKREQSVRTAQEGSIGSLK
jgi:hypothetical protein